MRKIWLIHMLVFAILASSIMLQLLRPSRTAMRGSMFVSDAGRSHGGFEYNASWNATLTVEGDSGSLNLLLHLGLGDALKRHDYRVIDFARDETRISMKLDGYQVILVWVRNDSIWNGAFNRYYIASWGGDAPLEEIRGSISPTIFPGLANFWYVELRLR